MFSSSSTPFVPLWNIKPSWSSFIWFYLFYPKKVILLLSSFSLHSAVPILFFFSRFSLSTPLSCTSRKSIPCHSIAPCGLLNVWPIQHHFLSVICSAVGICFVLSHNSSFARLTVYMTSIYVIGISLQSWEWITYLFSYFLCSTPVTYNKLNVCTKKLNFSSK